VCNCNFVKHVARSNGVPVTPVDHFMASIRSSVKEMPETSGGRQLVSSSQCSLEHNALHPQVSCLQQNSSILTGTTTALIALQQALFLFPKLTINLKCINLIYQKK
jgi:hypothetical protein